MACQSSNSTAPALFLVLAARLHCDKQRAVKVMWSMVQIGALTCDLGLRRGFVGATW
jgi:hypothetical protein